MLSWTQGAAARERPCSRIIVVNDSQVVVGAATKGRSASPALNSRLQYGLATVLGGDIYTVLAWVPSAMNPGDDPTRKPSAPLLDWWGEVASGGQASLDSRVAKLESAVASYLPDIGFCAASSRTARPHLSTREPDEHAVDSGVLVPARSHDHEQHSCSQTQGHQNLDRPSPQLHSSARPLAAAPLLDAVASAALAALPRTRFVTSVKNPKLTSWTPTRRGVLDLFSGSRRYARACLRAGAEWVLPYDILDDPVGQKLLSPAVRAEVGNLMRSGCFVGGGAGPVCSSFSKAITPPVRTPQHPEGISSV